MSKAIWAFLLVFYVLIAGVSMLNTGVTLVLKASGFDAALIGVVQSMHYVGIAAGSVAVQRWLTPASAVRVFGLSALAICLLSLPLAAGFGGLAWAVLRFLHGCCMAGVYSSIELALNAGAGNRTRARVFAVYQVLTYVSMAAGQWALGMLDADAVFTFASVAALFAVSAGLTWALHRSSAAAAPAVPALPPSSGPVVYSVPLNRPAGIALGSFWRIMKHSPFGLLAAATSGVLLSTFYSVFPLVVQALVGNVADTGRFLATVMVLAMVPLTLVAQLADRFGRPVAVLGVVMLMAAGLIGLIQDPAPARLWSLGLFYAALLFCIYGLGVADVNDRVSEQERGAAAALVVLMFSVGGCIGPVVFGPVTSAGGPRLFFAVTALLLVPLAAASGMAIHQRRTRRIRVFP